MVNDEDEIENVPGLTIPKVELTDEEAALPITMERLNAYHNEIEDDFLDASGDIIYVKTYAGYLMHKYPEKALQILNIINNYKCLCASDLIEIYELKDFEGENDLFYADYIEFINLTINSKRRMNEILISVERYYARD